MNQIEFIDFNISLEIASAIVQLRKNNGFSLSATTMLIFDTQGDTFLLNLLCRNFYTIFSNRTRSYRVFAVLNENSVFSYKNKIAGWLSPEPFIFSYYSFYGKPEKEYRCRVELVENENDIISDQKNLIESRPCESWMENLKFVKIDGLKFSPISGFRE